MNRSWLVGFCCAVCALALPSSAGAETVSVRSFDGTAIHVNFFTATGLTSGRRAPTVMVGPGWGSPGDTNVNDSTDVTLGAPGVGTLLRAGFNVLTWDPRGFGSSGGTVHSDNPTYEGRDVSAMISWLARQPQALLDHPGDPRVGMAGGSYGGGIQLISAAIDRRIDAIVPDIAWNSLLTSLDKYDTAKLGWARLLYIVGNATGRLDPLIRESYQAETLGQPLTNAERSFYVASGPGKLVNKIRAPTLLIEGTVDNLFTLQEAVNNYEVLRRNGVAVKMLWFCGGHGICLTKQGRTSLIDADTIAWLDHYLKRQPTVKTGPIFEWVDQDGAEHTGSDYPLAAAGSLTGRGAGTLPLTTTGGSGPVQPGLGPGALGVAAASITPAKASSAVNVQIRSPKHAAFVVGAPRLTITYSGLATNDQASTSVYAQIVDDSTGKLLGNQITPVPIRLDGHAHTLSEPLEILSATDKRGEHFTLQLTASSVTYETQRATGSVNFSAVAIALPLINPGARPPSQSKPDPAS